MIKYDISDNFSEIEHHLTKALDWQNYAFLSRYGQMGVDALRANTPVDTGVTRDSWSYEVHIYKNSAKIVWKNSNQNKSIPIVMLIQKGHATKDGGFVEGIDFINPAMSGVFQRIADDARKELSKK